MFISVVIIASLAFLALASRPAPGPFQPATVSTRTSRGSKRVPALTPGPLLMNEIGDRDSKPVQSALQAIGLVRRPPPETVVGEKAYVRWWERARAAVGLTVLVIALGIAFAATIGIVILGAGFLLEQAIS